MDNWSYMPESLRKAEASAERLVKVAGQHVSALESLLKEADRPGWMSRMLGRNPAGSPAAAPKTISAPPSSKTTNPSPSGRFWNGKAWEPRGGSAAKPVVTPSMGNQNAQIPTQSRVMPDTKPLQPGHRMKQQLRQQVGQSFISTMHAVADATKAIQPVLMKQRELRKQISFHFNNLTKMVDVFRQQFPGDPFGNAVQKEYATLSKQMDFTKVDPAFASNKLRESADRLSKQFAMQKGSQPMHDVSKMFPVQIPKPTSFGGVASPMSSSTTDHKRNTASDQSVVLWKLA